MSASGNRKKKLKVRQSASSIPARFTSSQAKLKQKTRLTRKYRNTELEIQKLLENTSLATELECRDPKKPDADSESIEFFCNEGEIQNKHHILSKKLIILDDNENDGYKTTTTTSSQSTSDAQEQESVKSIATHSEHSSSTHGGNQTASTFIQIESDHETCIQYRSSIKHHFDHNLLYRPTSSVRHHIKNEMRAANSNTKRMFNRYFEQAKSTDEKLSKNILNELQTVQSETADTTTPYRTFCLHKFHPIFCDATPNIAEIPTRQIVKIFFKEIRFTRHPQLCEEHTVANDLDDLYEEYIQRKAKRIGEELNTKLQIERNIVNALMNRAVENNTTYDEQHFRNLQEHLFKIKELRTRLYGEEACTKNLQKQILDKWLQLKKLRQSQELQCTRLKLRIKIPELSNHAIDKARKDWERRFQNDLSEIYREELEIYYSAKRLFKADTQGKSKSSTCIKPKKPSLSKLSAELKERYAKSLYMPEEPLVEITRIRASDKEFYENASKFERNVSQLRKLKSFFIRIHLDSEFVADSRSYRLEPDLSLRINEAIGVVLERHRPKEIKLTIFEKLKITAAHKIATIIVEFPITPSTSQENLNNAEFSMQRMAFASKKEPIEGRLYMGIKFQNCMAQNSFSLRTPFKLSSNTEKTSQHDSSDEGDDNEPSSIEASGTCTFEENLLHFSNLDDLKNKTRLKLLHSRFLKNDERTRNLLLVPTLDHEVEHEIDSEEEEVIETGCWMDPIDLHKHYGKNYIRKLYEAISNQCFRLDRALENTENLLIGDEPGNWSLLFDALSSIFRPGRPLNPVRGTAVKATHTTALEMTGPQNFSVVLNVVRATGVPVRYNRAINSPDIGKNANSTNFITTNLKYSNVRPFISFSYKDKFCRTTTAEGSNPTWNEQLVLSFSGSLAELRDDLKISLFDEIIETQVADDLNNMRNLDVYQKIQTNWLGEYRISMGTLLQRQQIEGNAELNVPKVLIGYKRPTLDSIATNFDTQIIVEIKESVQLYFYLSIEPRLEVPRINTKSLECAELKEVRQNLHEWSILVRELQPKRFVEPLVCTENGKRVCLTRLLEPIPLPIANGNENLMENVCRYVSLLSTMKNFDPCIGFNGVWLSNQTLLDTTWGSPKDLGVLLCNFLLTIGLKCWLALGISNTYGEVTFVIVRKEDGQLYFIEPCSGKNYSIRDILCPLNKIYYVIAKDNIFCNIQSDNRVSMMNFNFNDTSYWIPAFNKRNPAPLGGVQKLNYNFHKSQNTLELTKNIERKIMKKITSWRAMQKTIWNRALQPRLQKILLELEMICMFATGNVHDELRFLEQIHSEFPDSKMYGFALNFSYTNLSMISERIRSTSIHLNSDPNVEFSLATHVHVWPNDVLSVWIFLVSVTPLSVV